MEKYDYIFVFYDHYIENGVPRTKPYTALIKKDEAPDIKKAAILAEKRLRSQEIIHGTLKCQAHYAFEFFDVYSKN